jgi:hypothetical protein
MIGLHGQLGGIALTEWTAEAQDDVYRAALGVRVARPTLDAVVASSAV